MTYAPPPPPGPPPPGGTYGAPPPPQPGFYYGPPMPPGAPAPQSARGGSTAIIAIFVGALIAVAVLVGIIVFASQPKQPTACPPDQVCPNPPPPTVAPAGTSTPRPTLPPFRTPGPTVAGQTAGPGQTATPIGTPVPTPQSDSAPFVAGTVWRSASLGYSFEYDPGYWSVEKSEDAYAELRLGIRNTDIRFDVIGFPSDVSVDSALKQVYDRTDTFVIGRVSDDRAYNALLGPSIGYVRGSGGTFLGTAKNTDGTPGDPISVTAMAATSGKATVVVVVLVSDPDGDFHGETLEHVAREISDDIVKTFVWEGG